MTSAEIHEAVSQMMSRGENLYVVDEGALADARPHLVITQQLCEVCAVSFEDVEAAVSRLDDVPEVVSLDPHSLSDVLEDILRVGAWAGAQSEAHVAAFNLRARIDAIRPAVAGAEIRPRVACVESTDPVIAAGNWIPGVVETAGTEIAVSATWLVNSFRRIEPPVLRAGRYAYTLRRTGAGLAIARKTVFVLDDRIVGPIDIFNI